ncbi:transglycosylase SLT domain-containing protein [Streptomyces sp. NBC_01381]|uniref:transglycosylase SLT domain-containing protein n=1 Tax=Streptomyces sp. NBC_01381 TaxID=2903845 RepID=UPI00225506C3|nr:transglycosylase SLT domain-containing protein [Streptomyces sp. NBC_01381]MCX4673561.1 transglycosylase SLT domain-containing protein [Streptomyces sp. NBC_01381]
MSRWTVIIPTFRSFTRGLVAGVGGAVLVIPVIGATAAAAAPASVHTATAVKVAAPAVAAARPIAAAAPAGQASTSRDAAPGRADRFVRPTSLTTQNTAAVTDVSPYTNNLDGWIKQSLDIMAKDGIPGTYDGIYRNVMRESSGNPLAINNWDSNAVAGTPSEGLLQVIQPTFAAFHVSGTSIDLYDPVANITAACNYAAKTYGSIDNVHGAY